MVGSQWLWSERAGQRWPLSGEGLGGCRAWPCEDGEPLKAALRPCGPESSKPQGGEKELKPKPSSARKASSMPASQTHRLEIAVWGCGLRPDRQAQPRDATAPAPSTAGGPLRAPLPRNGVCHRQRSPQGACGTWSPSVDRGRRAGASGGDRLGRPAPPPRFPAPGRAEARARSGPGALVALVVGVQTGDWHSCGATWRGSLGRAGGWACRETGALPPPALVVSPLGAASCPVTGYPP